MNILCIETSSTNCSIALYTPQNTFLKETDDNASYSHSENLHSFIEDVFKENNIAISTLNAVAVSSGPGSYTGLRIGVATAKGIAYALGIPLISINSLEVLARSITPTTSLLTPMIDARRMEVFTCTFSSSYALISPPEPLILTSSSFSSILEKNTVTFIGSGAPKFSTILSHPNATFINANPSAKNMVIPALEKYNSQSFENLAYFTPNYLKDWMPNK